MDTPRIYVASLMDYNAGILHGTWIDADDGVDAIWEAINKMLAESPEAATPEARKWGMKAEECAIHDYEGFGPVRLSEYENIERVAEIGGAISEYGIPYLAWVADTDSTDPDEFTDHFAGEYESVADFGELYFHETLPERLPEWIEPVIGYVDWERYGNDLLTGMSHTEHNGTLYVFYG